MAKKAEVIITCNAASAKAVIESLNRELNRAIQEREQLLAIEKQQGKLTADQAKRDKELKNIISSLTTAQQKNTEEMRKYNQVIKDLAGSKTKDLKRALGEVKRALDNMSAKDPKRAQLVNDLKKIQAQIDANTGSIKRQQSAWGSLGTTMKNLFAYAGIFAGFNMLKSKLQEAYELNKKFADQMANVRKVSGLEMADIAELSNRLTKVDSRTSLSGLMDLSYTGAKLGFGNYGIEGLESFAKAAVKVQNALSEDMGADAMTALSKMVEVMGLIPKMGVEKAMDATGSAIFKLASTSTATGINIVEFSKRLMGLANIAHITVPELLAIGSAADSMALMPEVAATAFNKLITAVQKQPNLIENALKIEPGTISNMFQMGKMTDALVMIFEKMREKGGMNALMQSGVFKDLGSDGARLVAVMATMANRVDILQQHLQTSRQAFEESTAVAQEYAIQMDTAAAYSERAANIWEKTFVNPEGVDTVKEFTKAWYEVSKALTENEAAMAEIKFLLTGIMQIMKAIIYMAPALLNGLAVWGGARLAVWAKAALGITSVQTAVQGLTFSLSTLKVAWASLSTVVKANWIGAIATGIFMVIEALGLLNKKVEQTTGFMYGFKKSLSDLDVEYGKAEAELRRYRKAIDEANIGTKQRAAAINQFNNKFKPYLNNLLTEKSTADEVAKAYDRITQAMRTKLALQLKEKDISDQVMPREQWTAQRRQEYEERAKAAGLGQYGSSWITGYAQDNATKGIDQMVREIGKQYYNLPQKVIDEIAVQAKMGNSEFNNYGNIINSSYLKQANALLAASSYLRQDRSATNAMRRVNQKWAPEQKAMDAMLAAQQTQEEIEPLVNAPDKDAEKALTKAQQEEKKRLRKEMEDAQKDSTAVINAIEEFYRLQESAIEQLAADGKLTREEADRTIDFIRNRKDQMLLEARRAISGKENSFEELRKTMNQDLLRPNDTASVRSMQTVQTIDVAEAARRLQKFDGDKDVYDLNSGSFTQAMLKNAAQNELNIQRRQAKMTEAIDKLLIQYEYVQQAQRSFGNKLVQLGLITEGYDKIVQQLADGTEIVANTKDVQALGEKVTTLSSRLFYVNPDDAEQLANFISEVVTDATGHQEEFAQMFPNLDEWMTQPEAFKREMQAFYQTLLEYDTEYYQARKRNYELYKRANEQAWEESGRKDFYEQTFTGLENRQKMQDAFGTGQSFGQQYGLVDTIANDPEVELYKQKLAAAAEYYQFVESHQHTEQELREASQATLEAYMAMAQKVGDEVAERASKIQELEQPLDTFAEEVGQKWGDMLFNMESNTNSWNAIIKKMILGFAQMTIKMTAENLTKKIQQALFYKQMEAMETQHQAQMLAIQTTFGMMRIGAQQTMNATGQAVKSADDATTISKEASLAAILTQLGISEGAAKIIGKLGWWGIPLIGVISSLLLGLLSSALSSAGKASSNSSSNTKVKLVSGMLTYDEGNVGQYVGNDGHVYSARQQGSLPEGVSLVRQPIATTVNGQPSLVAEKGPEIVIGRRTTRQIMMNEPGLLRRIAQIERGSGFYTRGGMRTLDSGNLEDVLTIDPTSGSSPARGGESLDSETLAALKALPTALAAFTQLMGNIQQKGIPAKMAAFGDGSLDEGMRTVSNFRKKYPVG